MSGYHRISKLKNCLNSLNSFKNVKKVNENLGKEIDLLCGKSNKSQKTGIYFSKIKEVNQVLSKELDKVTYHLKNKSSNLLETVNVTICKNNIRESCKTLCSISDKIEEKKSHFNRKGLKKRYIKKEAEKLCQYLSRHKYYGSTLTLGATGLSITELPEILTKNNEAAITDAIPEAPLIPDASVEALNQLNALGEPTFASMGLGGWTPVGIVQQCMEYLHVTLGIDWWAAIVLGTLVIRICMFPLVVLSQRNSAKMNNYMPQIQLLQLKMTEARQTGDSINAARYGQEMMLFMKEKGLSPFKNMLVPLAQMPVFVSFFMGLRQMANVPVESLTHGGMFWFKDLTVPDQYFLMPIITSATLWLTIEIGTDAAKLSSQNLGVMKYALRAMPIIILPFTVNFPGAILCYWVSSNFISLAQVAFLRIPKVRSYFNIEPLIKHKVEDLPVKPKGFKEGIKDSWTNIKITKEIEDRRRLDEIQFQRAGRGPIQKTYKYDPTKQSSPNAPAPISAKKR